MTEEQLEQKLICYVFDVMLPKMPIGINKFLGYLGLGAVMNNVHEIITPYIDIAKKVTIIDENNNVDLKKLHIALDYAFDNMSSISLMGFTFTKADVIPFMNFINS